VNAYLRAITAHLPARIETNEQLQIENPTWDMKKICAKTRIEARRIAAEGETAADLAFEAANRLLEGASIQRKEIDYLLFCTQSPDYLLPTSACILQDRLRLPVSCGAIDFNLGCSGYVYGIQMARALLLSGTAKNILLLTGETYSKYIHPQDRSVRVLFGDGATASLINTHQSGARIVACEVGTDGSGYANLIVPVGGARRRPAKDPPQAVADANGSVRSDANLYMNGQELFEFTLRRIPEVIESLLTKTGIAADSIDAYVFHQANAFMNEHLRRKLGLPREKAPLFLSDVGNTVSSSIPLALSQLAPQLHPGARVMLVGFGVGYSWGACLLEWGPIDAACL
jgi:3-oxoacyl-[acyl-carrier-protein] synthase-3